jgi:hypothetical protein
MIKHIQRSYRKSIKVDSKKYRNKFVEDIIWQHSFSNDYVNSIDADKELYETKLKDMDADYFKELSKTKQLEYFSRSVYNHNTEKHLIEREKFYDFLFGQMKKIKDRLEGIAYIDKQFDQGIHNAITANLVQILNPSSIIKDITNRRKTIPIISKDKTYVYGLIESHKVSIDSHGVISNVHISNTGYRIFKTKLEVFYTIDSVSLAGINRIVKLSKPLHIKVSTNYEHFIDRRDDYIIYNDEIINYKYLSYFLRRTLDNNDRLHQTWLALSAAFATAIFTAAITLAVNILVPLKATHIHKEETEYIHIYKEQ